MTHLTEQLVMAAEIMVLGMGIVFCFLTLLIFCVNGMSSAISRYFPDVPTPTTNRRVPAKANAAAPAVVAAAAAAVQMHRKQDRC